MPLRYPEVARLLQINPRWTGFDPCDFKLYVLSLDDVLGAGFRRAGGLTTARLDR
jgi:hypothetical protein